VFQLTTVTYVADAAAGLEITTGVPTAERQRLRDARSDALAGANQAGWPAPPAFV